MVPFHFFKAFDEDRSTLNIFASRLTSDSMTIVRKCPAKLIRLDDWIPVFLYGFFGIFDCLEHHKSVVELLKEGPKIKKWFKLKLESYLLMQIWHGPTAFSK